MLPARLPNLIINGSQVNPQLPSIRSVVYSGKQGHILCCLRTGTRSQGIAVGMATNIPPHNVGEVVSALEALIKNPDISTSELLTCIPAPDFPTGAPLVMLRVRGY